MISTVRQALQYAKRGWRVFPLHSIQNGACTCGKECSSPGKHPHTPNGLKDATTNESTIRAWFKQWPNSNIGIATGEGLHVIDVDTAKGAKLDDLGDLPETLKVRTGSGGYHLYFKRDITLGNTANKLGKCIDTRGDGGYVVAPGSNHKSGGTYEWINELEPAQLPVSIIERLKEKPKAAERAAVDVSEEARNTNLASIAGSLRAKGMSIDQVRENILALNQTLYADHVNGPLGEDEIERTILRSAEKWEQGTPRTRKQAQTEPQEQHKPKILNLIDMVSAEYPEPRWAVPNLIPEGLTLFGGKAKMGKSWLVLLIALAIAVGGLVLGRRVRQGDVLYLALEDTPRRMKDRVLRVLNGRPVPGHLDIALEWRPLQHGGLDDLEGWLKTHPDARFVGIDTVGKVKAQHNSKDDPYLAEVALYSKIKHLADEYHVAIVCVTHLRKADATDTLDALIGSTGGPGTADAVLSLTRIRGQETAELRATGRDFEDQELALRFDPSTCLWSEQGTVQEARTTPERKGVLDLLSERGVLTPKQIATATGKRREAVSQLLESLVDEGLVVKPGYGKYQIKTNHTGYTTYTTQSTHTTHTSEEVNPAEKSVSVSSPSTHTSEEAEPAAQADPQEKCESVSSVSVSGTMKFMPHLDGDILPADDRDPFLHDDEE